MSFVHAIFFGILEGFTEFLPISSTGHLIIASKILALSQTPFISSFEIIIQLGAILAVVLYYRNLIWHSRFQLYKCLVAFIPTGILGFTLYKTIKHLLIGNILITAIALGIGGVVFLFIDRLKSNLSRATNSLETISVTQSIFIGLFQSLSMIPGVSRSAATIIGGRILGLDKKTSVEFSFLLAIPTMMAATGYDILKTSWTFEQSEYIALALGSIFAFLTSLISIKFFLSKLETNIFFGFGVYRILVSIILLLFYL